MNDSSFEAMAQEIDGLLGIDQAKHADWHADSIAVRGYEGIDARTVNAVRVLKRSIDARQRTIFINLTVRVYINEIPQDAEYVRTEYGDVSQKPQVVVVGEGPGGLFASLRLIELGLRPVVLERGKDVRQRKVDLANGGWLADSWRIVRIF